MPKRITEKLERRARRAAKRKERADRRKVREGRRALRAEPELVAGETVPAPPAEMPLQALVRVNNEALDLIRRYGLFQGEHHKNWLLDQVVRVLLGWYPDDTAYANFVADFDESESDSEAEPENGWRDMLKSNCAPP